MKRKASVRIPLGSLTENVLDFLVRRFTYHDRSAWQARLSGGRVRVNDRVAREADLLGAGDVVEYAMDDLPEPPVQTGFGVVFEDDDLLVVDKPGNLPCHPGGAYFNNTLWALLKSRHGLAAPLLVNRLDRETSGLTVIAKTAEAARLCRDEFAGRSVEKRYWVLVEGLFPEAREARGAMRPDAAGPVRKRRLFVEGVSPLEAGAEWAETLFRRRGSGGGLSWVEAVPSTGRLHQIRATLCAGGFPVVGDKLYGRDPELFLRFFQGVLTEADHAVLRLPRQALHAAGLRMRHPRTREWLEWEAPLPADMRELIEKSQMT
jgi:RluA family pseudouridine synthase